MGNNAKAKGIYNDDSTQQEAFITINTIDDTVFVERLPNPTYTARGKNSYLSYGSDNLYPNKIKSMAARSQTTFSAIRTLSRFSAGQGFKKQGSFDPNKLVINEENQTLFDILDHAADEKAKLGIALHFNYNQLGEIIEIQETAFESWRYKAGEAKMIFKPDWSKNTRKDINDEIEVNLFNPESVLEEINEAGGIENYNGQVLYWHRKKKEIYPLATFDSCLDDTQFEHESGVYKLRNIQNGYSANYVMFYPAPIESDLEKANVINETKKSRGANYSGKTKHIPLNASALQNLGSRKLVEEIPRTGIDKLFEKQNQETKFNIYSVFNQPPILNGIAKDGMFNQESFLDAFDYYNSITEKDRQEIERVFNLFMPFTIWQIDNLEIEPLEFRRDREDNNTETTTEEETQTEE